MSLSAPLLKWYDANQRALPWRVPSKAIKRGVKPDPYRVWLAEIMLQQTTVASVKPYFEKFTKRWPTVEKLARAKLNDVLAVWAGLGYYSRARNLHKCAKEIMKLGGFPRTAAELRKLPGIGPYTAAAIASIAFDESAPVVDGNIIRVLSRVFTVASPLPGARKKIDALAAQETPAKRAGDYAQALMDLGATICTPRNPKCSDCPLRMQCGAYAQGKQEKYPVKAKKAAVPEKQAAAYVVVSDDGRVLLRRRAPTGLLGGMTEVPSSDWHEKAAVRGRPRLPKIEWQPMGSINHVFSHFKLTLHVQRGRVKKAPALAAPYFWVRLSAVPKQALPTVMKKVLARAEVG
ncbi:MAG: A/G-specific adenine glycosylase [Bdellovibrionales bacterium]